jgi:hypothetical protein
VRRNDEQHLAAQLNRHHGGGAGLSFTRQIDRARVEQRPRRQHRVSGGARRPAPDRAEIRRQPSAGRDRGDIAIPAFGRLLQQHDVIAGRRSGQSPASEIVEQTRKIAALTVRVPGDDGKNDRTGSGHDRCRTDAPGQQNEQYGAGREKQNPADDVARRRTNYQPLTAN